MSNTVDDKNFQNAWFSSHVAKADQGLTAATALENVRNFAYSAFERLDKDGNGFIELDELQSIMQSGQLSDRERSFVAFLISNHQQISESFAEGEEQHNGISRQDLNAYFELILKLM
jgi:Ca2+-binding EF-hand superfamily protein